MAADSAQAVASHNAPATSDALAVGDHHAPAASAVQVIPSGRSSRALHASGAFGDTSPTPQPGRTDIFEVIREDLRRACIANQAGATGAGAHLRELFNPGTHAVLAHRFGTWARRIPIPGVRHLLVAFHFLIEYFFAWRVGVLIPVRARIGPGMVVHTWSGGIVLPACEIGEDFMIIGGGVQFDYETESVGAHCRIAPGTKFVGKIRIGNNVQTAPNSVIMTDVPDDSLAFGNPARIVPARRWKFAPTGAAQARAIASRRAAGNG